jgi:hypothetical protein
MRFAKRQTFHPYCLVAEESFSRSGVDLGFLLPVGRATRLHVQQLP